MANGLLDFIKTPEGQGLLSAAFGGLAGARRGQPLNSLGRAGLAGLQGYGGALDRQKEEADSALTREYRTMQMGEIKDRAEQAKLTRERDAKKRGALPGLFSGQQVGGDIVTPELGGVPMFSQGSTVTPTRTVGAGKLDVLKALEVGYTAEEIEKLAKLPDAGMPTVARTIETMEGGRPVTIQFDAQGRRIGDSLGIWKAPVQADTGGAVQFIDPVTLKPVQSLTKSMTPGERASNAVAWANNGVSRERLAFDKAGGVDGGSGQGSLIKEFGKAPTGYRWKADGTMEAVQGGPADIKAGELGAKREQQRKGALAQADRIIGKVDQALDKVGLNTTGIGGSVLSRVPGSEATNLKADLETIRANLGFAELQAMRDASPTGGALGQVAVQELTALQSTVASLDQAQSAAQLKARLGEVRKHYKNWKDAVQQSGGSTGGASGGWEPSGKKSAVSSGGWSATEKK